MCEREREREGEQGGAEREEEGENPRQTLSHQLKAGNGAQSHEPRNLDLSRNQESEASSTESCRSPCCNNSYFQKETWQDTVVHSVGSETQQWVCISALTT